ncbi:hypothetical protein AMAG_02639 [Allomyces macrogynus ATCC 38327]|uniref:cystathionine gamma-lyase n=1 Tax=Allomyces macrogynus (strain ATCC 38327) TaxID=578462 RepID=A0A0L0S3A5_ALLM3|nr:hypothetical protein AMAG_02639 [Allomyces macrogynus ATCC 38327]|eukprot:KNE56869.1 hypothetical protein AMAG_02639 [Allomyces macrogynus ATCC 38327]
MGGASGRGGETITGAVVPPISLSTTFKYQAPGQLLAVTGFVYSRDGNPARNGFESAVAALEGCTHGVAFASGSAAIAMVIMTLPKGSHVISVSDVYGGTFETLTKISPNMGYSATFITSAMTHATKLIWLESPINPTMKLVDIAAVAAQAIRVNLDVLVGADNTFLSPTSSAHSLGAEVVVHSATKYLNGHSDVSPLVELVIYPGLASHLQHELDKRQRTVFGGMIAFRIKGDLATATAFFQHLKTVTIAESLGVVESLAELPATMTHGNLPVDDRIKLGITDNLIRVSVSVEDAEDIIQDVLQALEKAGEGQ